MNEYEFEYELEDGWCSIYFTWAPNKLTAYENFIAFLKECNEDPDKTRVLNCCVVTAEGDNYGVDDIS